MAEEQRIYSEQLLLDWPVNEKFAQADFLPSRSNEKAVQWIDTWPEWKRGDDKFHCLIIYGPDGCGKTHLSHVWQNISNAVLVNLEQLPTLDFMSGNDFVFVIEDVDNHVDNSQIEESLFHLYNWVKEQGGYLLLTARKRPKLWPLTLADLSSRLLASEVVKIDPPEDDLLRAIIIKQFSDRQIKLADDVINYILPRTERSFEAVRRLVKAIDRLSLVEKKKITISVVRRVLEKESED